MKFKIVFGFALALVAYVVVGQNCNQSILSKKIVSQTDSSAGYVLTFQNLFHDSLVFVIVPNDGKMLTGRSLNFLLTSDSTISMSRDGKDASHLLNFIPLRPGERFSVDLKVEGAFNLSLGYRFIIISAEDFRGNQKVKTRKKDRYRKEIDFIASHKFCERSFEIVR